MDMANTSLLYERLNAIEVRQINYQTETDEHFERVFEYISENHSDRRICGCWDIESVFKEKV